MKKILIAASLILLSSNVFAQNWEELYLKQLKVDSPNQLRYAVGIHEDCPITDKEAKEIVEGVIIRSRIKPIRGTSHVIADIYLSATVECIGKDGRTVFPFVNYVDFANVGLTTPNVRYGYGYSTFGRGDKQSISGAYKERVEEAMTDYIKANFDL